MLEIRLNAHRAYYNGKIVGEFYPFTDSKEAQQCWYKNDKGIKITTLLTLNEWKETLHEFYQEANSGS